MSETGERGFSDVVVERFARAWASMDGKAEAFDRERGQPIPDLNEMESSGWTGHYVGYMEDARELLKRANCFVATRKPEDSPNA